MTRVASVLALTDTTHSQKGSESAVFLRACYEACVAINAQEFIDSGLQGKEIAEAIRSARKIAIAAIR